MTWRDTRAAGAAAGRSYEDARRCDGRRRDSETMTKHHEAIPHMTAAAAMARLEPLKATRGAHRRRQRIYFGRYAAIFHRSDFVGGGAAGGGFPAGGGVRTDSAGRGEKDALLPGGLE